MRTLAKTLLVASLFVGALTALDASRPVQAASATGDGLAYPVVDTGQVRCYAASEEVAYPAAGAAYFGQDAHYGGRDAQYRDNGDGTVTDLVTGLMWQQTPPEATFGWRDALAYCEALELAEHDDWRAPTLKELYSISDFSQGWPYLDPTFFCLSGQELGKDQQYWSSNAYLAGTTHGGAHTAFGVNHATGHIKGYPSGRGPRGKRVRAVRGERYGVNDFVDNGDGTVTDRATGLTWMKADSGHLEAGPKGDGKLDWPTALAWAEGLEHAGHTDWRLPNAKELQSIVDYSGVLPAIDPLFACTPITNEGGNADHGYYWTSTSAYFGTDRPAYTFAWYVAFGRAVNPSGDDTHGAGAVRFDAKVEGGPDGEGGERVYNLVRCVRGGQATPRTEGPELEAAAETTTTDQPAPDRQGPPREGRGPRDGHGNPPPGGGPGSFIERLDRDGDRKISREEFDGPDEHFQHLDKNSDGFITEDEAAQGPPPGPPPGRGPGGGPNGGGPGGDDHGGGPRGGPGGGPPPRDR